MAPPDWSICILCQKRSPESLICPKNSRTGTTDAGYLALTTNIRRFHELGELPLNLDVLNLIDDDSTLLQTFTKNNACWHKSCYLMFNNTKLKRAEKRKSSNTPLTSVSTRRRLTPSSQILCIFCETPTSEVLNEARTMELDAKVRRLAMEMCDGQVLAKLSAGDMVAIEAKYHHSCLIAFYNRHRSTCASTDREDDYEGIVFAELVSYIDEERNDELGKLKVFRMAELAEMYSTRLSHFKDMKNSPPYVHRTRLRDRLLDHFTDMETVKSGREYLLTTKKDLGDALLQASTPDAFDEGLCLLKVARIIRKEILANKVSFDCQFKTGLEYKGHSKSLSSLMDMILHGTNIKRTSVLAHSQHGIALSQLIQFNTQTSTTETRHNVRHNKDRETPLPVYLGLLVHSKTRSKEIVEKLHSFGITISYKRVLEISSDLCERAARQFSKDEVVCPLLLKHNEFTTAAVDNIDYNPSSTTSKDSFHGTGISLFQHPSTTKIGTERELLSYSTSTIFKSLSVPHLPDFYTTIEPIQISNKEPALPGESSNLNSLTTADIQSAYDEEVKWLTGIGEQLENTDLVNMEASWSAFHATRTKDSNFEVTTGSLLPLFHDEAHTYAMIKHSFKVVTSAIKFLNPGQVPVLTMDQPLYAISKTLQWSIPDYSEDKLVIMFGGLHIEQAWLKVLGEWIAGSGWTAALVRAEIATSGTADSFLKVSHITKTRQAHQLTIASLHTLLQRAYTRANPEQNFSDWCAHRCAQSVQFQFWYIFLQLELYLLYFVRSLREAKFELYLNALKAMIPWFFALDHHNYARWIPVHIRDMASLLEDHPSIYEEFCLGNFVVHKTRNPFSALPIDQAHEQHNACVKGKGGAVGLLMDAASLRRWMIAGPEISALLTQFDSATESSNRNTASHHEQYSSFQKNFTEKVYALTQAFEEMGSPFDSEKTDLLTLDSAEFADDKLIDTVKTIEELRKRQYAAYVQDRLIQKSVSIFSPIKRNKLTLFKTVKIKPAPQQSMLKLVKADRALFSRLYIACQTRDGNLEEFFKHENQSFPPSISDNGEIRLGSKADLTHILESLTSNPSTVISCDAVNFDGAAIVNMLLPKTVKTFLDYSQNVFNQFIVNQAVHVKAKRIDIVWDTYQENSLKSYTRNTRGLGIRRNVRPNDVIPQGWNEFLRNSANKEELFKFLSESFIASNPNFESISTKMNTVLLCPGTRSELNSSNHEEADTRIFLHVEDAVRQGYKSVMIRTVDTDVVVLATALYHEIRGLEQLFVAFGTGKHFRTLAIHSLATCLGPQKSKALLGFHAFTGCDTVSCFNGRGKKSCWEAWKSFDDCTEAFAFISHAPASIPDNIFKILERFTILCYNRTSDKTDVNKERKNLFTKKGRTIEGLPPTSSALFNHSLRAAYQAGHIWGQSRTSDLQLPCPSQWGWKLEAGKWHPNWSNLPEAGSACRELIKCACKIGCKGRCSCKKANLPCTALCQCECEHYE